MSDSSEEIKSIIGGLGIIGHGQLGKVEEGEGRPL